MERWWGSPQGRQPFKLAKSVHPHNGVQPPPPYHPIMSTTKRGLTLAVVALAGYTAYRLYRARNAHRANEILRTTDDIAEEFVESVVVGDQVPEVPEDEEPIRRGIVEYAHPKNVVEEHMVITDKTRYTAAVLCSVKNRFGTPANNNANRLAVRKFCLDKMTKHGVRPSHISKVLPVLVHLAFVHSDDEIEADKLAVSAGYRHGWAAWALQLFNRAPAPHAAQ